MIQRRLTVQLNVRLRKRSCLRVDAIEIKWQARMESGKPSTRRVYEHCPPITTGGGGRSGWSIVLHSAIAICRMRRFAQSPGASAGVSPMKLDQRRRMLGRVPWTSPQEEAREAE